MPVGGRADTWMAGVEGSTTMWLRWQIGQLSGAVLTWWCQTIPSVVHINSARSAIGTTIRQIFFCSDMVGIL